MIDNENKNKYGGHDFATVGGGRILCYGTLQRKGSGKWKIGDTVWMNGP